MKLLLQALFVIAASAIPVPDDDGGNIDVIVNGVSEGEPLELGNIIDIKAKEHVDGELVAFKDVLQPFTAQGLAAAAAVAAAAESAAENLPPATPIDIPDTEKPISEAQPELPAPIVLPPAPEAQVIPEAMELPEPIVLPELTIPEVPLEPVEVISPDLPGVVSPVVISPEVAPVAPIVVEPQPVAPIEVAPQPVAPIEVAPQPVAPQVPEAEALPVPQHQEIFNDGNVQAFMNVDRKETILSTVKQWFNIFVNYINGSAAVQSMQIV